MSENRLRVVTYGQLVTGFDQGLVEANLVRLCKFGPERMVKVFSGEMFVFKSDLNHVGADRYLSALTQAGIVCSIETIESIETDSIEPTVLSPSPSIEASISHQITCPMCNTVQNEADSCINCEVLLARGGRPRSVEPLPDIVYTSHDEYLPEKKSNTGLILLIIALIVGLIGTVAVIGGKMLFDSAGPTFKKIIEQAQLQESEFEAVPPPAIPPVQSHGSELSTAERQEIYDLLEARQFAQLNTILTQVQSEYLSNPVDDWKVVQAFNLFSDPYLAYRPLFDEWVAAYPDHFAPRLARGRYFSSLGWENRGGKYASETADSQFAGMHDYFDLALGDLEAALDLNPQLLPAYITMINIYKAQGPQSAQDETTRQAQQLFPTSYELYKKILKANEPRWGGSYTIMTNYAHQANEYADQNPEMSFLYSKPYVDQAWYAKRKKKYPEAIALYTKALAYGEYIALYESRGHTYVKMNDPENALLDFNRALEITPDYSGVLRKRATLYFNRGEYAKALADIQTAQGSLTARNKPILRWYRWAIKQLLQSNDPALNNYIFHANLYTGSRKSKPYPEGQPLKSLDVQSRFQSPQGTFPFGLTWFKGSLYMSSYRQDNPGIYQLDPTDGRVINFAAPDIVYKEQYGGLTSDANSIYHVMGYYGDKFYKLDPNSLESDGEQYLYSSQFQLGDLARHNGHTYAIAYHQMTNLTDYRLLKFSDDGKLRDSFTIKPVEARSASPGLASDGTHLWVSMGSVFYRIDPENGDIIEGYSVPDASYGLAWDGEKLWGVGDSGEVFTYAFKQ